MSSLDGIRVADFSRTAPGPYCGMLLADLGAEVIRIDRAPLDAAEVQLTGTLLGRGKQSIALDLKAPSGVAVARRLIEWSDVLIEGFRPGVMERLGLGPDDALALNPRVVYARVTGWGQHGELRDRAGHDINYIAVSGCLGLIGRSGDVPVPPLNLVGDFAGGGMWAALGILAALLERERSGVGQVIDAAMVDGSASLLTFFADGIAAGRWGERGANLVDTGAPFYEVYECGDRRYFAVGAIEAQFYAQLLAGLGIDPTTVPDQMDRTHWPAMKKLFADVFATRTRDEWIAVFESTDACATPVLDSDEAATHPYNASRGTYLSGADDVLQPLPGPRMSRTTGELTTSPPLPGADTEEVLKVLGFGPAEVDELLASGAAAAC